MSIPDFKKLKKHALMAADWFVNSQVPINRPQWDANAGRFIYNYHIPTKKRVNGLGWTQGRGIMVLMAAYRLTGRKKYLEAGLRAKDYLNALQIYDQALPYFGSFAEEIPQSDRCWPRDGAEAASGYLHVYNETGDKDLVRRARLFGDWMLSVSHKKHGFPPVFFYYKPVRRSFRPDYWTVGCGMLYSLLYRATGSRKYLKAGLKPMLDMACEKFIQKDGTLTSTLRISHHAQRTPKGKLIAVNDDGMGAALLSGERLMHSRKYLEAGIRLGDWLLTQKQKVHAACSLPNRLCYLMDLFRLTGNRKYYDYVLSRLNEVMKLQVTRSKDRFVLGGFRGEDEPPQAYVQGSSKLEYVTTRVTTYAALLLFKLVSKDWTPGYSCFGWKRKGIVKGN
jgi:hypothetical protein